MEQLLISCLLLLTVFEAKCELYKSGLDNVQIAHIIQYHNNLRKFVAKGRLFTQLPAANLQYLTYSADLAKAAQKLANSCVRLVPEPYDVSTTDVGQSVYFEVSSYELFGTTSGIILKYPSSQRTSFITKVIKKWFDTHELFKYWIEQSPGAEPYFEIVGAFNKEIGCGLAVCTSYNQEGYRYIMVCNYGRDPAYNSTYPYETGDGCKDLC